MSGWRPATALPILAPSAVKSLATQLAVFLQRRRSRRNVALLLRFFAVLAGLVVLYSVLFHYLMQYEGREHSWLTGLYWTLTVMSTLGFGDITFHSDLGRAFSMVVLLSGIVFLLVLLPFTFIQFFYAPWMEAQQSARAPRELPETMRGHVVMTQHDAVTSALIPRLRQYDHPYVIIVPELDKALRLHDEGVQVMLGDLDDPETYRRARVGQAALVATTLADAVNTNVAFTVRGCSRDVPIISTANDPAAVDILQLAGASHVLRLGEMMGQALARRTLGGDAMTHTIGRLDELVVAEANACRTPLVGRTLRENRLTDLGVTVVGVWDRGRFEAAGPDTMIQENTVLVLAGTQAQLQNYDEHFAIYNVSGEPVVIIGGGRVGRATARALTERGIDYRIVEQLPARVRDPKKYVVGSAAELEVLKAAGIMKAPTVIITTHEDSTNIYLTIYCRRLRPDIQIISRATLERNVATLHRAGADFVMSYSSMGAGAMLNLLRRSDILMVAEGVDVVRMPLPSALAGRRLEETSIRRETGCTVIGLKHGDQTTINPGPSTLLEEGDEIVLIGTVEAENKFLDLYTRR